MEITFNIPDDWDLNYIVQQLSARFPEYRITAIPDFRRITISAEMPVTASLLPWIEGAMWGLSQHK